MKNRFVGATLAVPLVALGMFAFASSETATSATDTSMKEQMAKKGGLTIAIPTISRVCVEGNGTLVFFNLQQYRNGQMSMQHDTGHAVLRFHLVDSRANGANGGQWKDVPKEFVGSGGEGALRFNSGAASAHAYHWDSLALRYDGTTSYDVPAPYNCENGAG